jgi:hypothetical protein
LFNFYTPNDDGDLPWMSARHLEVFAKATKTRIILLSYWGGRNDGDRIDQCRQRNQFTCLEIDWRFHGQRKQECKIVFEDGIPDFDFRTRTRFNYWDRTVVVMHTPTLHHIDGDWIIWKEMKQHYTLWLPKKFFDEWDNDHTG